jgi:hypothetical protein
MGLTRLRAEQISDIDYKQAVRVITISNITLSGGAPSLVDGVTVSVDDRVLVTGQSTGSQNGIYQVETVGTGSNGTWIRSTDTNATGELEAGTIVMVTEGTTYADTQWKLTTNNPIIIGTTALTFEQNSAYAFGNVFANGTAVLANSVGSTVTFTAGNNIQITGNNTSKTVTIGVTGISLNSISNGTSNVNVVSSGGNITVGVGGTGNVAVFSTSGLDVTGRVSATGNITGGNLLTSGQIGATGTVTSNGATNGTAFAVGNSAVSNVALGMFPTAGTAGEYAIRDYSNVASTLYLDVGMGGTANGTFRFRTTNAFTTLATITTSGINTPYAVSATGNITGNNFIGNGSQLTGIVATAGAFITNGTSNVVVSASGNVTVGVAGTATVATFTTAGLVANSVAATNNGNATNFKVGDDAWLGDINTADTIGIRGQQNAANAYIVFGNADNTQLGRAGSGPLTYGGAFSATGNITGLNLNSSGADLAEKYVADSDYTPGTVVEFGGTNEITISTQSHSTRVAGIVSTSPGHLMNVDLLDRHVTAVALTGRVPCRVIGKIQKGDCVVSSSVSGVATALDKKLYEPGCIIGKALDTYDSNQIGTIEVAVGRF